MPTILYDLEFRNYDLVLGRMFQVDPMAAKYVSLTTYNYSFNNPVAFTDPSGADPDPDYQNPNHQYYFHNGAGVYGRPGLTYDDYDPMTRLANGDFQCARCWDSSNMMGWLSGGGRSLNAEAFGNQTIRYMTGLARSMANLVDAALSRGDGVTLMNFSGGHLTSSDYKSTEVLFREVGRDIAREFYGGDGRMGTGYMPPSYNLFPAAGQVVGMLPGLNQKYPDESEMNLRFGPSFKEKFVDPIVKKFEGKDFSFGELVSFVETFDFRNELEDSKGVFDLRLVNGRVSKFQLGIQADTAPIYGEIPFFQLPRGEGYVVNPGMGRFEFRDVHGDSYRISVALEIEIGR